MWKPGLVWLHLLSDLIIGLSYYSIPGFLIYFARKRQDMPFSGVFWLFGAFIIFCGTTHFMAIWTLWYPTYWLSGLLKAGTALVSLYTALQLRTIVSLALALPSPEQYKRAQTALKQANELLEQRVKERTKEVEHSLSLLQTTLEATADGILVTDLAGKIVTYNQQFLDLWEVENVISQKDDHLVLAFIYQQLKDPDNLCLQVEREMVHPEIQSYLILELQNGKICERYSKPQLLGEQIVGRVISCRDISDRKQAEQKLREARDELEIRVQERTKELYKTNATLEQLNTELQRSNEELEHFAYIASHDLQEPLRAVAGYSQFLAEEYQNSLDETAQEYIRNIIDGAARMRQLIQDLLAYSRVTKGKPFSPTDCNNVLRQALDNLQVLIAENNATITYDSLPTVTADRTQLVQLFQNLIGNAIKFRRKELPEIQIAAELKDEAWLFSVKDNGIGIKTKYLERIFQIFQRLHTRTEIPGTGIGLAICKKIVERHHGRIWAESEPEQGTTFFFIIPQ